MNDDDDSALYLALHPHLYRIAVQKFSLSHEDAEDLIHETLVGYLKKKQTAKTPRAFILAAFYNGLNSHLRKKLRVTIVPLDDTVWRPVHTPLHVERLTVRDMLRQLSPRDQHILDLRYFQGYKVREIAAELRISHGRAEKLLRAALERAAAELLEENRRRVGLRLPTTVTYASLEYHPGTRCLDRRWTNSNRSRRSASRSTIRWHRANTSTSRTSFIRRASS